MTKLYEVDVELGWQNLNTLTGVTLSGEYELWNAGREHDVVNIFYTESEDEPTDESFYKALPRQNKAIIEVGEQPIWVKSEVKSAKLIISTSIEGEASENIADIEEILAEIKGDTGTEILDMDFATTANVIYTQIKTSDTVNYIKKMDTVNGTLTFSPNNTAWADRATATYTTRAV